MAEPEGETSKAKRSTAVVFDKKLESHFSIWNKEFTETPKRVFEILQRCEQLQLLERCLRIPVRPATDSEILKCHSQEHLDLLERTKLMSESELQDISQKYDYIYFHTCSADNARLALGGIIDLVDAVVSQKVTNGIAIIRPPGHHAMYEEYCGYCYFGNVAIAAQIMLDKYDMKRILILDWDVHHGQGSQFMFYDDPRVMYVSIHRYEHGVEWPNLREGDYDFTGDGPGKGFNINVPLNEIGCDNSDYLAIWLNLLLPIFYQFQPELILVSAGFDCAIGCPEGEMAVTPACFAHFVNMLKPLAGGRMALVLEGGYNLKSLAESAALSLRSLLGDPTPAIAAIDKPKHSVTESILNCIKVLHHDWPCLQFQDFVEASRVKAESYPYQGVLHLPPVKDVVFNTSQNRPEMFPLLQECANEEAVLKQAELNKAILELIRSTRLLEARDRWGLVWGSEESALLQHLKESKLWSSSFCLKESSPTASSALDNVQLALSSLFSDQVHCCLCLLQPKSPPLPVNGQTLNGISPTEPNLVNSLAHYAISSHKTSRLMVLDLAPDPHHQPTIEDSDSVLYVAIRSSSQVSEPPSSPQFIDIPLSQGSVNDADIITVVLQLILPIAYQFSPQLLVIRFSNNVCLEMPPLTCACLGHMIQLLSGLAGGKLFLLVEEMNLELEERQEAAATPGEESKLPEAEPERVSELTADSKNSSKSRKNMLSLSQLVEECIAVAQGTSTCSWLPAGLTCHDSTVSTIKRLQDKLKDAWSVFQFRVQLPIIHV